MSTTSTASEIIDSILTAARVAAARIDAMPKGPSATDAELRARRTAIGTEGLALRKLAASHRAAILGRPEAELMAIDLDEVDARWAEAAGPLRDRNLSEIIA